MKPFEVLVDVERIYTYSVKVAAVSREHAKVIVGDLLDESGVQGMELVDEHTWSMNIRNEGEM